MSPSAKSRKGVLFLALFAAAALANCTGENFGYETRPSGSLCQSPNIPPPFHLETAFGDVSVEHPTDMVVVSDSLAFVLSQTGVVYRVHRDAGGWKADPFLDLHAELPNVESESGLLSIALPPDFAATHVVYISYIGRGQTTPYRLGVYRFQSDGVRADPASKVEIYAQDRELPTHHGGKIRFGPDGYLYIASGDGTTAPPKLRPQDPNELYGKILRIDVSGPGVDGKAYRIPPDNPFVGKAGRPEVFALGLRNPWSLWFDAQKRLWAADVGNDRYEEIDIIVPGGNYGWPYKEGTSCLTPGTCDSPSFIEPVIAYPHVDGFAAIGGFIYKGAVESLRGRYIYGDFISGRVWSASGTSPTAADPQPIFFDTGLMISGLLEDTAGEILALDWGGNRVLRIAPTPPRTARGTSLRALGCLDGTSNEMVRDLVPYDVNSPLWSDGADKRRWISVPTGKQIAVKSDDSFEMPGGTMFLKEFSRGGKRIETRMMFRDPDLDWLFYTFKWNAAGTDAELVGVDGADVSSADGNWHIPSQGQCLACHGAQVGRVRGFEVAQINRSIVYPGGTRANQVSTLGHVGYFDRPPNPEISKPLPAPLGGTDTLEHRARAYLHANCSFCHSVFLGVGGFNLTYWQPLNDLGIICRPTQSNTFGLPNARIVVPGSPDSSLLVHRMKQVGPSQMPPIGRSRVDEAAVRLISDWIQSMPPGCPP